MHQIAEYGETIINHINMILMCLHSPHPFLCQIPIGVAAHWDYKLQNKISTSEQPLALTPSFDSKILDEPILIDGNIIRQAPDVGSKDKTASYIDALTTSRENLVKNNVFIFISSTKNALDGRIVSLNPSSSLVSDLLNQHFNVAERGVIRNMNISEVIMYRNGVKVNLSDELVNGDVVTLPPELIELLEL